MGTYRLPTFCLAFLLAMVVKQLFRFTGVLTYIDPKTTVRLSGTFTDILVAFGIASVKIPLLIQYAGPLIALFVFGILLCWVLFRLVGPRAFHHMWFEKSLYTWGWTTGVMALAIALLRITDPGNKSHILGDFALAYLVAGFVEVLLVTLAPILVSQGQAWTFTIAALIPALVILILTIKPSKSRPGSQDSGRTT
jgi:ESS family glutamate:Na+ symporter